MGCDLMCCCERESRKIKRKNASRVRACVWCRLFDAWQHTPVLNCSICRRYIESGVLYMRGIYPCTRYKYTHTHHISLPFIGIADIVVVAAVVITTVVTAQCVNIDTSGYCVCIYVVEYKREVKIRNIHTTYHTRTRTWIRISKKNLPLNSVGIRSTAFHILTPRSILIW